MKTHLTKPSRRAVMNLVAVIAIISMAVFAGTATAAKKTKKTNKSNLIRANQIASNQITQRHIKNGSLTSAALTPAARKALQGQRGLRGLKGEQGDAGADGAVGATGATGARGPQGAQGPKGDKGEKGEKGDAGADGAVGATGAQGPQGDTGPQGPQGEVGPQGPRGEVGPQGPAGKDAPAPEYGVGGVWLRTKADWGEVPWGRYVTSALPSMMDLEATAGGSFPVECKADDAPCMLFVTGQIASDKSNAKGSVQAHVNVDRRAQTDGSGAHKYQYCNNGEVANQAPTRRAEAPRVNIEDHFAVGEGKEASANKLEVKWGSNSPCFVDGDGSPYGGGTSKDVVYLPAGKYTISATFRFWAA